MRRQVISQLARASSEAWTLQQGPHTAARCLFTLASMRGLVPEVQNHVNQPTCLRDALRSQPCESNFAAIQSIQKRSMFIQTQPTPNPTSLMFLPGKTVMDSGSKNFSSAREAMASPLAKRLFLIDGVNKVFFGTDFITVTKSDDYAWSVLKPDVFAAITEFYAAGEPVLYDTEADPTSADHVITDDDDEIVAMIKELLETRIRPAVQEDGGDIAFRSFDPDSGIVELKMMGACSGCPSSAITLKSGIENMLCHYIPEVKGVVEAEPDEYEEEGVKAFHKMEQHLSN